MASLGLFLPQQLASLLLTFARWRLPFSAADLLKVIERLAQLSQVRGGRTEGGRPRLLGEQNNAAGDVGWHPLFSPCVAALDANCRISCLYSLGVLLRPCAAAVATAKETSNAGALNATPVAEGPPRVSVISSSTEIPITEGQLGVTCVAAEALGAGERLFQQWIGGIFLELSLSPRSSQDRKETACLQTAPSAEGGLQPVIKLAEALANCA